MGHGRSSGMAAAAEEGHADPFNISRFICLQVEVGGWMASAENYLHSMIMLMAGGEQLAVHKVPIQYQPAHAYWRSLPSSVVYRVVIAIRIYRPRFRLTRESNL